VTIVSGLAAAAKQGILIKGGVYLEEGRKLRWLALDKTGTITHGRPVQTNFEPRESFDAGTSRRIAVSLASRSDHPVSRALAMAGEQDRMSLFDVTDFTALLGRGVSGIVDGKTYRLGNHRLMEELGVCSPDLERRLESLEKEGKTTLALTDGSAVLAIFGVADTVRDTSRQAITDLHALGIKSLMLTGDNEHTANAIGTQVGIDEIRGNLLPENKSEIIAAKIVSGDKIGMVGDGINDAPALARADIGFAMGAAGTDSAIETADVALMDDDLRKIPAFYRLSRATHQILVQNIAFAIGIKAIFLGLTFAGRGTMWMAVFADMGASLLVVFNGLRLLRMDARFHDQ
jgi:Cd2+/Zn2+-exporting ATPase